MVPSCRGRVDVFLPAFLRWLQKRLLPGAAAAAGPAQGALGAAAPSLPSARPGRLLPSLQINLFSSRACSRLLLGSVPGSMPRSGPGSVPPARNGRARPRFPGSGGAAGRAGPAPPWPRPPPSGAAGNGNGAGNGTGAGNDTGAGSGNGGRAGTARGRRWER